MQMSNDDKTTTTADGISGKKVHIKLQQNMN